MSNLFTQATESAAWIRAHLEASPTIALITGSGLGGLATLLSESIAFSTSDIPHWPQSTVEGHAGRVVIGQLAGKRMMVMQGRVHFYEGYDMQHVTFPIRVMQQLGIKQLIVTNAAGGLEATWAAGDMMMITDHINLPGLAGHNPLIGPNEAPFGPRFPSLANAYTPRLRELARQVAAEQKLTLREGVYVMVSGPFYETPAEVRMLYAWGAQAVGMSTAPEVVVAAHAGMEVLAFSLITNMVLYHPTPEQETSHEEVLDIGSKAAPKLMRLIESVLGKDM